SGTTLAEACIGSRTDARRRADGFTADRFTCALDQVGLPRTCLLLSKTDRQGWEAVPGLEVTLHGRRCGSGLKQVPSEQPRVTGRMGADPQTPHGSPYHYGGAISAPNQPR